jgi:hypothetical protein
MQAGQTNASVVVITDSGAPDAATNSSPGERAHSNLSATNDLEALRSRAQEGDANAQIDLARRCANGEGVPHDYVEAANWYRKAAEQGDADAQFHLGSNYANGEGVPQDYDEAVKWLNMAAAQGNAFAQKALPGALAAKSNYFPSMTTRTGQTYEHVIVIGKTVDFLLIKYTSKTGIHGFTQIRFENLLDDLQRQYTYDPQKALAYKKTQEEANLANAQAKVRDAEAHFRATEAQLQHDNLLLKWSLEDILLDQQWSLQDDLRDLNWSVRDLQDSIDRARWQQFPPAEKIREYQVTSIALCPCRGNRAACILGRPVQRIFQVRQ